MNLHIQVLFLVCCNKFGLGFFVPVFYLLIQLIFYPDLVIDKIKRDDGTTVYIIENADLKTKFQFASRSMAWPAGYLGG